MSNTNGVLDVQVVNENNTYTPDVSTWYDSINGSFYKEDPVNGTDITDSMGDVQIKFMVPEGYIAVLEASLTVDDWGRLDIVSAGESGENHLHLGMMKNVDDVPGPRGGHALWSKHGNVALPPGEYIIYVYHENATYVDAYADKAKYNISKCEFAINATKERFVVWPTSPVVLSNPITWYYAIQDSSAKLYKFNTGTISELSAEEFGEMARVIFAEASNEYEDMKAIAAVMLNRLGNSPSMPFRNPVLSILDEINASRKTTTNNNPKKYWVGVNNAQYKSVQGENYMNIDPPSKDKLIKSIDALHEIIRSGTANYPYTYYNQQAEPGDVKIGVHYFKTIKQYHTCTDLSQLKDSKGVLQEWDKLPIAPNSPLEKSQE